MASGGPARETPEQKFNDKIRQKFNDKIRQIADEIKLAEMEFGRERGTDLKDSRLFERSFDNLQQLFENVNESAMSPENKTKILGEIISMIKALEKTHRPNLHDSQLSPAQKELKQYSLRIIRDWRVAGSGINLQDLSKKTKSRLDEFTRDSPLPILISDMIRDSEDKDPKRLLARNNLAILIFQTLVCRFGLFDKNGVIAEDHPSEILIWCIAEVAVARCKEDFNILSVLPDAAHSDPSTFIKDLTGSVFAALVAHSVTSGVGPSVVGGAFDLATEIGKYIVANPVSSFLFSASVGPTVEYIDTLIKNVLKRHNGEQYQQLFDELSAYYRAEGVRELIGVAPIDEDTVISKLGQLLYKLQFQCVTSTFGLRQLISKAVRLPQTICSSIKTMVSSAKDKQRGLSLMLIDRYGFIPVVTEKVLFQEVIRCLEQKEMLEDPNIAGHIRQYLNYTKPQIPFAPLVQLLAAQSDTRFPITKPVEDSITAVFGDNSSQEDVEIVGPSFSDDDFEVDPITGNVIDRPYVINDPFAAQLSEFRSRVQLQIKGQGQGQRPRSRDGREGGMKTKRRKLPTSKKQKSKKNKRQSRRKVRRSSSRKAWRK
jgi:hypothetical protein